MPLQININYLNGFPAPAMQAVNRACNTWEQALDSTVDVNIDAYWGIPLPGLVAMCVPNGFENFPNAPLADTWYTGALADKLCGQDCDPGLPDMAIYFNSVQCSFNTNPAHCPLNDYDLETIALHEMGHGFGFIGLFWVVTNAVPQLGSYGSPAVLGQIGGNLPVPFNMPVLNFHPSVFGRLVHDANGQFLTTYPNNSAPLAAALQSNALFLPLPNGVQRPIYAPAVFQPSSSGDHFTANSLMVPAFGTGVQIHAIDAPTLDVMTMMGW